MAEGVLVMLIGSATKKAKDFEASDKEYEAEMTFGTETDSLDATGRITSQKEVNISEQQLNETLEQFRGDIEQVPPMVSALKKDGVRLYKLARQGIEIVREPRKITIHKLELMSFDGKKASIRVECTKGTYIRSLCADIGAKLGCGAMMSKLTRTRSGSFKLSDAITLEEAIRLHNLGELEARICPT
jgi:tRNA pseudouridine55 synthase